MSIKIEQIKSSSKPKEKKKEREGSPLDFLNKEISFSGSGLKDKQKEEFYANLGMLLSSGIDMRSALKIVCEEKKKRKEKEIFEKLFDDMVKGMNLSESMKKSGHFSDYECYSIGIGEETGRLNEVLNDIATYFTNRIKQKRQLVNTFTYPLIVIVTALLVVIFMMNFIVPMFMDIFKRFSGELPALTQWVLDISQSFNQNFIIYLLVIITSVITFYSFRKKEWYRKYGSLIVMKIPVVGPLVNKTYMVRYCHTMALLLSARIPLLRAIRLMRKMISYYPFEKALEEFELGILHGKTLFQSMEQFSVFDTKMKSLTKVGEEINQLDRIYTGLSKQYNEELQHQIGTLNSLLEPVLIIFVGVFVALILVAMYLPMFQMSNSFA
ncbi:type II secretion system F family protein [Marinifilum fragile]|uniref:type II secretion system F family protein n=1 Tax=Marinifilum fragile TaxID=570161 RepID=UPI002AAABA63|nr:type II secretion system F family protein [Marinifilum fragile]